VSDTVTGERQQQPIDDAYIERIHGLLASKRTHEAVEAARTTLARSPENDRFRELLVHALVDQGQTADAVEQAEFGLEMNPSSAPMHAAHANALLADRQWSCAVRASELAVDSQPEHVGTLLLNVDCLLNYAESQAEPSREFKHVVAAAAHSADRARLVAPDLPDTHFTRARVHLAARQWPDVEHCATSGLQLQPDDPFGHRLLGVARAKQRDRSGAVEHILAADRLDPDTATTAGLLETTTRSNRRCAIVAMLWLVPLVALLAGSFNAWMWGCVILAALGMACLWSGVRQRRRCDRHHASMRTAGSRTNVLLATASMPSTRRGS